MMKGDYLVVWDETTASSFADWFFHVPGSSTIEWQPHKIVSKTPWGVDLDMHFVLPSAPLVEPTFPGRNISTSTDSGAVRNMLASQASEPTGPGMFTTMGESRFGDGSTSRNPFPFQWLKYVSVRNDPDRFGDFLTVLHPRKSGITPELGYELVSASDTAVTLRIHYNGRTDTIAFTSSGATVTKGGESPVQFALSWPQSGVSGASALVKADFLTTPVTTLANPLTTTGPVEVHTGELALGAAGRIPDTANLVIKPGGTFNTATFNETVGTLILDGGVLKGTGTLTASGIEWWGGIVTAPVSSPGNFVKKGGGDGPRPASVTYSGDTVIESGKLVFNSAASTLPGSGRVVLRQGTGLKLDGVSASISGLDVSGTATLTTGAATLAVSGPLTGSGVLASTGNLNLAAVTAVANTLTLQSNGLLTLPGGALTVKRLILNGVTQPAGVAVSSATHPGQISGAGTITPLEDIPVPTGLSGSPTLGKISLTWNSVPGVTGYVLRRATTSGGPYTDIGTPASPSFTDTQITDGVVYRYVVAARDATGTSANSAEISVTAVGPWYFDPNGSAAGSVSNGGSYDWVTSSWTKTPGGTAATEASGPLRHVQFAATSPGLPLAYSVAVGSNFSGGTHGFRSLRVTQGMVTFTGTPGNFYFTQPPTITADAGTTIRFAQTGALAFNLNKQNVTFDGAGTTLVSNDTVIMNSGSITKSGSGTLVLASPGTYSGSTTVSGGTLRLAVTDLPALWLDATKSSSLALASGAVSQWNDANGRTTFVSQATAANRPLPVTDATLSGPARSLVDFGAFTLNAITTGWMQFGSPMTDIRALFWVGKTTNENFLLGSTGSDYAFHSGGAGLPIWSTQYAHANIRNGTTWLNGTQVPGTTTNMPAATNLVRIGNFNAGNVSASAIGRDRTYRSGGIQPGEVMIFNTVLSAQQQTDIDAYLAKKWFNTGVGIGNRLPIQTTVLLSNAATLDLTGVNFQTIAGLEANDNSGTRVDLGAAELTVSSSDSSSFDGEISGTGSLRKSGAGTFVLLGTHTYTGSTVVEGGTLDLEGSVTSDVTVRSGATVVNHGTIHGNLVIETGGNYLGDGTVTGNITTPPPVVTITSPSADGAGLPGLLSAIRLTAGVEFNLQFGTPAITWTQTTGPGTVTFAQPASADTTATFSASGTYTLRCTATVTVNGQPLTGWAERTVIADAPSTTSNTKTFREGENGYSHACALIRSDWTNGNAGVRDQFIVGTGFRSVFSFPLSGIPADATVVSASLEWFHYDSSSVETPIGTIELRRLTDPPVEGSGNGSSSTSGSGTGVSWTSRTGAVSWSTPGGDFDSSPGQLLSQIPAFTSWTAGQPRSFASSAVWVAAIQSCLTNQTSLDLIALSPTTTTSNRYVRFVSDDHATVSRRPLLTLTYTTGVPSVPTLSPENAPTASRGVAANLAGVATNASGGCRWSMLSGPGIAEFSDPASPAAQVTFSQPGIYLLQLSAANTLGEASRLLAVTVSGNPAYPDDWQQLHWPGVEDGSVTGPGQDPDSDGLPNLAEWALHLDPKKSEPFLPSFILDGNSIRHTYTRRKTAPDQATFVVEWTDSLLQEGWTNAGVTSATPVSLDSTRESVTSTIPASPAGRRFVQVRISTPQVAP